uniref:Uncharacterized protein n=1 Tax=Romanomermis culicivorax TaxID=13658 RepID=A0A915L9H9_ROMCU
MARCRSIEQIRDNLNAKPIIDRAFHLTSKKKLDDKKEENERRHGQRMKTGFHGVTTMNDISNNETIWYKN